MSTKTSPPSSTVKIKKEVHSDEIKDFAETAMNELLGWYGYENVDKIDLATAKAQRIIGSSAASQSQSFDCSTSAININNSNNSSNNSCNEIMMNGSKRSTRSGSTTPDHESSREGSRSPSSTKTNYKQETLNCGWCHRLVPENSPEFLTTPDGPRYCSESCFGQSRRASFKRAKTCDWCRHVRHAVSYVDFQDGASQLQFCSDKCLNQYKMQIFCKETQAHLDMNPHLKEKAANMSSGNLITPELWLKNCRSRSASPELSELSRSPSPSRIHSTLVAQERCVSSIISINSHSVNNSNSSINNNLNKISNSSNNNNNNSSRNKNHISINTMNNGGGANNSNNHKPIISVAPVAKLMSKSPNPSVSSSVIRQNPKHSRKKRTPRPITNQHSSAISINSHNINETKSKILANTLAVAAVTSNNSCSFSGTIQDLRMNASSSQIPTVGAIGISQASPAGAAQGKPSNITPLEGMQQLPTRPSLPSVFFPPHGGAFPIIRPPFLPPHFPRIMSMPQPPGIPPPPPPPPVALTPGGQPQSPSTHGNPQQIPPLLQNDLSSIGNPFLGTVPPVTVMVPYPVILPLPIPIPIPLPIMNFLKAANLTTELESNCSLSSHEEKIHKEEHPTNIVENPEECNIFNQEAVEEPLDFTKTKRVREEKEVNNSIGMQSEVVVQKEICTSSLNEEYQKETEEKELPPMKINDTEIDGQIGNTNEDEERRQDTEEEQRIPKFKITRLHMKRLITKESENSRPLRKRKRVIDCDFLKATGSREDEEASKHKK